MLRSDLKIGRHALNSSSCGWSIDFNSTVPSTRYKCPKELVRQANAKFSHFTCKCAKKTKQRKRDKSNWRNKILRLASSEGKVVYLGLCLQGEEII